MKRLVLSIITLGLIQWAIASPTGKIEKLTINAPSLQNNIIGESTQQPVWVYLPPSYNESNEKRYPVVYLLIGYTGILDLWEWGISNYKVKESMDRLITTGKLKEMIVVMPNGYNKFLGSFYANSMVTGNWEDFITKDVTNYITQHFRTINSPNARAIAGHSMGGYGALNLAMKNPNIFSIGYGINPGLFDKVGMMNALFNDQATINSIINTQEKFANLSAKDAHSQYLDYINKLNEEQLFMYAYGTTFAADTTVNAPYMKFPYKRVNGIIKTDTTNLNLWFTGYGDLENKIVTYHDSLLKLKGYYIDYGTNDQNTWIPKGCLHYSTLLKKYNIPHYRFSHNGDHINNIKQRIESFLMPYCDSLLSFDTLNLNRNTGILNITGSAIYNMSFLPKYNGKIPVQIIIKNTYKPNNLALNFTLDAGCKIYPHPSAIRDYSVNPVEFLVVSESTLDTTHYEITVKTNDISNINTFYSNEEINISPNPSNNGIIYIQTGIRDISCEIEIYDLKGYKLYAASHIVGRKPIKIDLSEWKGKTAIVIISSQKERISRKIIL